MNSNTIFQEIKFLIGAFVVIVITFLAGCSSMTSNEKGNFNSQGMPNHKYLVGGGLDIEWRIPEAGTVYLVEEKTGKIIITKSFSPNETFEFSSGTPEPEETKEIFGEEMSELKFSLYFIPKADFTNKD